MKPLPTALSAVVFVLLLASGAPNAWAQDNADCAVICDMIAGCAGGASSSGSTGVAVPTEDSNDGEPPDNDVPPGEDEPGGDEPEEDVPGDDDPAEAGDDGEIDAEVRAACMASCAQLRGPEPALVTAAAGCAAELEHCWDFAQDCGDLMLLPACVAACEKLVECGQFDPCGDSSVSSGGASGADSTDAVPPQAGGNPQPEERQFHLECDDDGSFNEDEAVVQCAGGFAQAAFIAFDELSAVVDCIGAEQCGEVEEICADEVKAFEEADGVSGMGGGGSAAMGGGGRHSDDSGTPTANGAQGQADGDQAAGGGTPTGGGGGGGAAGGGRSSKGGTCASAPGRSAGGLRALIGIVLRR